MNLHPHKTTTLPRVIGQVLLAILVVLVTRSLEAGNSYPDSFNSAGEKSSSGMMLDTNTDTRTLVWVSDDNQLLLYGISQDGSYRVCPRLTSNARQAFCRQFDSPVITACGSHEQVVLVMENGDIYEVNRALIGLDGSLDPAHHPEQAMQLQSVWFPRHDCLSGHGLPKVLAVGHDTGWRQFNGEQWKAISPDVANSHIADSGLQTYSSEIEETGETR